MLETAADSKKSARPTRFRTALWLKALIVICFTLSLSTNLHAKTILVLGDSISAAYGMPLTDGWVNLLRKKLEQENYNGYEVINASVSGNTSGDGLLRLPGLLKQHSPTIVIVELGGNDGLRGYPLNIMRRNLQKIIDLSQQQGAQVLLAGIEIPPNYGLRYTRIFRETFQGLAQDNKVAFLPFILENVALIPGLMQRDGIHPTASAQPQLLANLWPHLQPLLLEAL